MDRINIESLVSANWDKNYNGNKGPHGKQTPCLICGRGVSLEKAHWVNKDCTTGEVVKGFPTDHQEYGCESVGSDCWRKYNSILAPFEVDLNTGRLR